MKNLQKLKIATIISFLLIVFPGKIDFINLIAIILGLINFFFMIGFEPLNFDFIVSIFTITSIYLFFNKNRYIFFSSILLQYFYLFYTFKTDYLEYWCYTFPTSTYFILSLVLIYTSLLERRENKKNSCN